uniref:Uncharacterized protein n=1 Tax=Anguilla anguilla TaxID=7936 RepID=A0A0E9QNP1_ANGAN
MRKCYYTEELKEGIPKLGGHGIERSLEVDKLV